MKLAYASLMGTLMVLSAISFSVFAQSDRQVGSGDVRPSSARSWGVSLSDSVVNGMRDEMIKQVGIDAVITARFESARNRLEILGTRLDSRIDQTDKSCPTLSAARKSLDASVTTLRSVDTASLVVAVPTDANDTSYFQPVENIDEQATMGQGNIPVKVAIDTRAVTTTQTTLDTSLSNLRASAAALSKCPQYVQTSANAETSRATLSQ